jgi:lysylphosphatidylglycerol synthetase-like protein (DUF2156 family)
VAAALLANVLYSGGFVLEKRALAGLPQVTVREPARLLRLVLGSPLWIAGSLALASGFAAQLVVYRTLPIAAAQGIFVSGLVLLVLLSARLLGEETSGRERYALAAILAALLMVVLSLDEGTDTVSQAPPTRCSCCCACRPSRPASGCTAPPNAAPCAATGCRRPASSTAWRWACCTGSARWRSRACRATGRRATCPDS